MDDTKQQWMTAGLERFSRLEDTIFQTVEEIKALRKENEALRSENSRLNEQANEQSRDNEALRGEIDRLTQIAVEYEKQLGENDGLQQQIATMRQSENEMLEELAQFEREREELRERVEKLLSLVVSLDAQ